MTFSTAMACFICMFFGGIVGIVVDSIILDRVYQKDLTKAIEEEKRESLRVIRENHAKNELNNKILLDEIGEALDVDVVELPSFGLTVLKGAMSIPEGPAEPHMREMWE